MRVELVNRKRARSAYDILSEFAEKHGEGWAHLRGKEKTAMIEQNMADLMANLIHLCSERDIDFDDRLRVARAHFQTEKNAEQKEAARRAN